MREEGKGRRMSKKLKGECEEFTSNQEGEMDGVMFSVTGQQNQTVAPASNTKQKNQIGKKSCYQTKQWVRKKIASLAQIFKRHQRKAEEWSLFYQLICI